MSYWLHVRRSHDEADQLYSPTGEDVESAGVSVWVYISRCKALGLASALGLL